MLDGLFETGKVQNFRISLSFCNIAQEVKDSARIWSEPDFGQIWKKAGFLMEPDLQPNFSTALMFVAPHCGLNSVAYYKSKVLLANSNLPNFHYNCNRNPKTNCNYN